MGEMVERIAKALAPELWPGREWESIPPDWQAHTCEYATAVLNALREPTPEMIEAGEKLWIRGDFDERDCAARLMRRDPEDEPNLLGIEDLFAAMIDAALSKAEVE